VAGIGLSSRQRLLDDRAVRGGCTIAVLLTLSADGNLRETLISLIGAADQISHQTVLTSVQLTTAHLDIDGVVLKSLRCCSHTDTARIIRSQRAPVERAD